MSGIRIFVISIILIISSVTAEAGNLLRMSVYPYLAAPEVISRFSPLIEYLEEQLGCEISLEISRDYREHIEKIGRDQVDIAYLEPASYVKTTSLFGAKKILARLVTSGNSTFQGTIVVNRDAPFTNLGDLKGKRFAFGDPNSAMSHLLPRYMLLQAGITLKDLAAAAFVNSHQNVALGVLMGHFDAGALEDEVVDDYRTESLRALVKTPSVPEHLFVGRSGLDGQTTAALQRALLNLEDTPGGMAILTAVNKKATGLSSASEEDYNRLQSILQQLGPVVGEER